VLDCTFTQKKHQRKTARWNITNHINHNRNYR